MDNYAYKKVCKNMPILETPRLVLRKINMGDLYDMNEYSAREETSEYLLWTPHLNLFETKGNIEYIMNRYKSRDMLVWGVVLKENNKFIGTCGFTSFDPHNNGGEIGYVISPDYWGKGLAREAINAVLGIAFKELRLHRMIARIMKGNVRSEKAVSSCGFTLEGAGRDCQIIKGKYATVLTYSILEDEYEKLISV